MVESGLTDRGKGSMVCMMRCSCRRHWQGANDGSAGRMIRSPMAGAVADHSRSLSKSRDACGRRPDHLNTLSS